MTSNSEARKAREAAAMGEAELHAIERCREHRREVVRDVLADIYDGAGFMEADAFLLKLDDRGGRVVL